MASVSSNIICILLFKQNLIFTNIHDERNHLLVFPMAIERGDDNKVGDGDHNSRHNDTSIIAFLVTIKGQNQNNIITFYWPSRLSVYTTPSVFSFGPSKGACKISLREDRK